ncbi:TonB-dependent receptor [Endobacterium cereale]|uniref:TonB-dependent receptor n=1 Tax=Endobacterium cereale TaxID=2663029 RepID=UPI002B47B62C|nr:TonB-dependent hemoglobin/transferrin/lactoferrin family receptor [Endobacterium cereale]MEB2844287.1 TonB-dependent hemoglobin/transferrin/lactoferrin family receptor [Endobacterium cereale]
MTATVALMCGYNAVHAQSTGAATTAQPEMVGVRDFSIPPLPLASALSVFNRQSGIQITQASGAVNGGATTAAVRGRMTPHQALAQMLAGTDISYRFTSNRAAVIGVAQESGEAVAGDGTTVLAPIMVTGDSSRNANGGAGFQGTPDWVYEEPSSVSVISRQAAQGPGARNARDLLDNVAGVMTNRSEGQNPGVQVNIRGLQDNNRVATMIDGARQNFQRGGHGGSQQVYVDQSFIRTVEVEKTSGAGVGGAGSLGGSVNFRTLTADDIIQPGETWGGEFTAGSGSNAFYFDGNLLGAYRFSDDFSVLAGVSRKRLGNYKTGELPDNLLSGGVVGGEVLSSGYESFGSLLKFEAAPADDFKLDLNWLRYDIDSSLATVYQSNDQRYLTNTVTSSFSWDPDSDLVDMKGRIWLNTTDNDELRRYNIVDPVSYGMKSFGGSLENTSRFDLPAGTISLNYGVEAYRDIGKTDAIARLDDDGVDGSYGYKGMNPSGRFDMASGFLNATFEHDDWLMVRGGLRYDRYSLSGSTQLTGVSVPVLISPRTCIRSIRGRCVEWQEAVYEIPQTPNTMVDVDKSGGAWLPSATIAVKPLDWFQPFVTYSESYRPPSVLETLMSGGHPNVAPVDNMPNPNLLPETGRTWEIGANISRDGVLTADDNIRIKAVWFHRNIENYISMGRGYYAPFERLYWTNVNLDGTTRMRGLEMEASYDAGTAYAGLSYTRTNTDLADTYLYNGPTGIGLPSQGENTAAPSVLFVVPKQRFTVDAGLRLFDERLVIGGRMTYVEETTPTIGQLANSYTSESYRLYDVYGSYAFNENTKLRFAVNNITDEGYWPALGTRDLPGPGRTFTASLNVKF